MAHITLTGVLLDPTGEFSVGDRVRFTHRTSTGDTVKTAQSMLTIPPDGSYSIDLEYGEILVEYSDYRKPRFKNVGVVVVNEDSTATSIPELLNAVVPPSDAQLIEFQAILADTVSARDDAVAISQNLSTGVAVFPTYALLDDYTPTTEQQKASFKVTNDPNGSLNGYYHWVSGTTYSKDDETEANQAIKELNGARIAYFVGGESGAGAFDFQLSIDNLVVHTGNHIFIYADDAYGEVPDVGEINIPIPDNARWLIYNNSTKSFRFNTTAQLPLRDYLAYDDHIVAVVNHASTKIVHIYGVDYSIDGARQETTHTLPQLSVGGSTYEQGDITMEFDSDDSKIRFPSNVYLFGEKVGTLALSETNIPLVNNKYEVDYTENNRFLIYNHKTKLMRGTNSTHSNVTSDDLIVAMIHAGSGAVGSYNSTGYRFNGVDYTSWNPTSITDNIPLGGMALGGATFNQSKITMAYDSALEVVSFPAGLYMFSDKQGQQKINETNMELVGGRYQVAYENDKRHLVYNLETKLMRGIKGGELTAIDKNNDIRVADIHGASGAVMNFNSSGYSYNGSNYFNWVNVEDIDQSRFGEVTWGSASLPLTIPPLDFDFDNNQILINASGAAGMYTPDGFIFIKQISLNTIIDGKITVPIDYEADRHLIWDNTTKLFYTTSNPNLNALGFDEYLCATFARSKVLHVRCNNYAVNGEQYFSEVSQSQLSDITNPSLDDNKILYNYVLGQEEAANRFSAPFLNVWEKGGLNQFNFEPYFNYPNDLLHMNTDGYNKWKAITTNFIETSCDSLDLTGKTMGIFGGSWSVSASGNELKQAWIDELGITVINYGVGGAGFAIASNSVDTQIAAASSHDIYLLWCSSNDCSANASIGNHNSPIDITSQMGGLGKAIKDLTIKNPSCRVLILSSGKAFDNVRNWDTGATR